MWGTQVLIYYTASRIEVKKIFKICTYIWLCPWPAGGALDSFLSDSHIIRDILGTVEKVRHTTYVSVKSVWQPTLLIFEDRVFLEFSLDQIIDKSRYRGLGGARY